MSLLSMDNIIREVEYSQEMAYDFDDFLARADSILESNLLEEVEYNKITKRFELDILNIEEFVRKNDCQCVSDPRAFTGNGIPSPKGLLSNEIFGYTMEERSGIYAYIDLHGWFIDPSCYKTWIRLDPAVKNIVHGVKYYRIDKDGLFVEDEVNGETGIEFLRKNIKRIKFKPTTSVTKELSLSFLETNRDRMFINKYIVIPPFYRDKNTTAGSKTVGLGGVNKIYNNLIISTNALTATQEYGFDASDAMMGKVQELILTLYDW